MPPAILKAAMGIPIDVKINSPATTKKINMAAETNTAFIAMIRLFLTEYPLVTAMNTGTVPIGSMTAKKK